MWAQRKLSTVIKIRVYTFLFVLKILFKILKLLIKTHSNLNEAF